MAASEEAVAALALKTVAGLGVRRINRLIEVFGTAWAAANASAAERASALGGAAPSAAPDLRRAAATLARTLAEGATVVALTEPRYPPALAAIYDPPPLLFVHGELAALSRPAVAVVGTRRPSVFGVAFATDLAEALAAAGLCVVSGLAFGIDAAAHRGALRGGVTAAVLGGSVSEVVPRSHQQLANSIVDAGGTLVSEHPHGTGVHPAAFVERNRVVSGLTAAVVVVEAGARSGALITSDFALEQGRTVFAVPGRPGEPASAGTLALLRDGAVPLGEPAHLFAELGWHVSPSQARPRAPEAARALQALAGRGPLSLDALAQAIGLGPGQLAPLLGLLEIEGAVRRTPGGKIALSPGQNGRDRG